MKDLITLVLLFVLSILSLGCSMTGHCCAAQMTQIPNGHSFNILHMEGIADELKRAGITQNEMKSGEGYSKLEEVISLNK